MPGFGEPHSKDGVTQLLKAWSEGDDVALEQLTPVVENELRRIAHRCMARENPGHILQSAALVNTSGSTRTRSPHTATSSTACLPCSGSTKRCRQSRRCRCENWMVMSSFVR